MKTLKTFLEDTYQKYHKPENMRLDPLLCVHGFTSDKDTELTGFLASSIAYGRAEIIIRNVNVLLDLMEKKPFEFIMGTTLREKKKRFNGFKHRFNSADDIALLLDSLRIVIKEYGSVESLFIAKSSNVLLKERLDHLTSTLKSIACTLSKSIPDSFNYLLPSPLSGSACKRMNMYLRWMVREKDGIDFGIWKNVSSSTLIMPVDTHIAKIGRKLEFTNRNSADWRMAEEITSALRIYDANDPVRFDFSLCRAGMFSFRKEAA